VAIFFALLLPPQISVNARFRSLIARAIARLFRQLFDRLKPTPAERLALHQKIRVVFYPQSAFRQDFHKVKTVTTALALKFLTHFKKPETTK
jgi:hypothetical protein